MSGELVAGKGRGWLWPTAATVVGLLTVAYFYRKFWTSGFTLYQGDVGDGRLTALIAAHWADPAQFGGGLTDVGFYFPAGGGLGFSDAMLAFGLVVAPLMWLGMGVLPAFQWTLIAFTLVGYTSTIAFLRLGPRSPWPLAIVAGVVVNASNGLSFASGHPQLIAFSLCPVVLLGALRTARSGSQRTRVVWGLATGLLAGLIAYSAFYVGWFLVLGLSLTAAIAALLVLFRSDLRPRWARAATGVVSGAVGFALWIPVFLVTYQPVLDQPRIIENVLFYSLRLRELTNVSPRNLLWGHLIVEPQGDLLRTAEWSMAPTPVLVVAALSAAVVAMVLWRQLSGWSVLGLATVLAGVIVWLLPVEFHGFAPWRAVFYLPGASALRAIGRIELLAGVMYALGLVILLTQWWRSSRRSRAVQAVVFALMLLIALEQTNMRGNQAVPLGKLVAVDSVSRPPATCDSFVLLPPFEANHPAYEYLIDAMFIADSTGLPTWNGYSGGTPEGWNLWPDRPDYLEQVRLWRARYRITNACGLRLPDGIWLTPDELAATISEGSAASVAA